MADTIIDVDGNELTITEAKEAGLNFYDPDNPRSIVNIVPPSLGEMLKRQKLIELVEMDEDRLYKLVKPNLTLQRLRKAFWREYEQAQMERRDMVLRRVYSEICSKQYFDQKLIKNYHKVAWMLKPVTLYMDTLEEALEVFHYKVRGILDLPLTESKVYKDHRGRLKEKKVPVASAINAILKVGQMVEDRVKGAIVKKTAHVSKSVEEKNYNVNMGSPEGEVSRSSLPAPVKSMDEIDAEIAAIQKDMNEGS